MSISPSERITSTGMTANRLAISVGMHSAAGAKEINQDFHGLIIPDEPSLKTKGIAIGLADGISSSKVSGIASESAIKTFLTDYYCTSDLWSVKTSAYRVIAAINSWLHAQTRRELYGHDIDRGYVCTFSGLILKSSTAYLFHVGDSRIYRLKGASLEQLTEDHRLTVSSEQSYLARALGVSHDVEIDYRTLRLSTGDIFILTTDGVHEHITPKAIAKIILSSGHDLDAAARQIVVDALANGSRDNLTIQIIRIDSLPLGAAEDLLGHATERPLPPVPEPGRLFDGYRIERQLHASSRSHVFLATDLETQQLVVIKIPSIDLRGDEIYLKRFMMEEWIARRIDSPHVLKAAAANHKRNFLYTVTEWVEGQTLAQWIIDHPRPDFDVVRGLVEQIGFGLRSFHRKEMLHQDLRPANVMIDRKGTVKIIDFGSTLVAGVAEASQSVDPTDVLGTAQFSAPEYYLGEGGSTRSDIFSLGAIAYHMLTGQLPYGTQVAAARTRAQQRKLVYATCLDDSRSIPFWADQAIRKAVHVDPLQRYDEVSEFLEDLRRPNPLFVSTKSRPLLESNPNRFWKGLCLLLSLLLVGLLALHVKGG